MLRPAAAFAADSADAGEPFERTPFQKGVVASTDAIVIGMPVATLVGIIVEGDWQGLKQAGLTAVTSVATSTILKHSIRERRPDGSNMHSFPSGHSSTVFANAAFLQRRYGWKIGAPAYALATYTAVGRVVGKKHHWWDVVAGAAIGAGSAYLFTTPWARDHDLSLAPYASPEAAGLSAAFSF